MAATVCQNLRQNCFRGMTKMCLMSVNIDMTHCMFHTVTLLENCLKIESFLCTGVSESLVIT